MGVYAVKPAVSQARVVVMMVVIVVIFIYMYNDIY